MPNGNNGTIPDTWSQRFTAYGALVVTIFIFSLFAYNIYSSAQLDDKQAFNGLNETIKAMAMIAVGFWLGSSNSGQKKDETIAAANAALATSAPAVPSVVTETRTDSRGATTTTSPATERAAPVPPTQPPRGSAG